MGRSLRPNPRLTKELRVTLQIAADEVYANGDAITEAMTDSDVRATLVKGIHAIAVLLAGIHAQSVEPQFAARRARKAVH